MIPNGLQSACCAIIGEQIGAQRVHVAKLYFRIMCLASLIFLVVLQVVVYTCKDQIVGLFTSDPAVYELAKSSVWIINLTFFADMIQGSI